MIQKKEDPLKSLKQIILKEEKILQEISTLFNSLEKGGNAEEKNILSSQLKLLQKSLYEKNEEIPELLGLLKVVKSLPANKSPEILEGKTKTSSTIKKETPTKIVQEDLTSLSELEKKIIRRLKKSEEEETKKVIREPSTYIQVSNRFFADTSRKLIKGEMFLKLKEDLIKTNLQFTPVNYTSVVLFSTILSVFAGIFIFIFLLFFNFPSFTLVTESISQRFINVFWIIFAVPVGTFLFLYFYPSLEKKSLEDRINQELPFATIHMSAISGSMINPVKIFEIMVATKEYPNVERELVKLMNEINIYGSDLVNALKKVAMNCPSAKLVELFNGLATNITSGGDLTEFFNKRAETLLLGYRLEREKYSKSAETFMDIYISVVIAAPMILMLLLIMMKISGFGISLSTNMITLIMVMGVSLINVVFLTFLKIKQPST